MIAYKAFNSRLQATLGKGIFQFEPGKTYEESECKCAKNGFHCAENPIDCLDYYSSMDTRFFIVEAAGDINQDGDGSRISCTRITLKKEITRFSMAVRACMYMENHPDRNWIGRYAKPERGRAIEAGDFMIVRGKHPEAEGVKGSWIFLVQEKRSSREISGIYHIEIDGQEYKENTWYRVRGGKVCEKQTCAS